MKRSKDVTENVRNNRLYRTFTLRIRWIRGENLGVCEVRIALQDDLTKHLLTLASVYDH